MKKLFLMTIVSAISAITMNAQSIIGKWKSIDEKTNEAKSIVQITEKNGVYYGTITEILTENKDKKCDKCPGKLKGKPILGMTIIYDLKKDGDEYTGGKILDPTTGKEYKCTMKLNGKDKLDLRGYIGISLIGRTQTWERVK